MYFSQKIREKLYAEKAEIVMVTRYGSDASGIDHYEVKLDSAR